MDETKKTGSFDAALRAAGMAQTQDVLPLVAFECTLTEDPARRILEAYSASWNEGQGPQFDDILRAIAHQHPALVDQFSYLPWPHLK